MMICCEAKHTNGDASLGCRRRVGGHSAGQGDGVDEGRAQRCAVVRASSLPAQAAAACGSRGWRGQGHIAGGQRGEGCHAERFAQPPLPQCIGLCMACRLSDFLRLLILYHAHLHACFKQTYFSAYIWQ